MESSLTQEQSGGTLGDGYDGAAAAMAAIADTGSFTSLSSIGSDAAAAAAAPVAAAPAPASAPAPAAAESAAVAVGNGLPAIDDLLRYLVSHEGSDLHLRVGEPPVVRIHGHLTRLDLPRMTPDDTKRLMYSIMNEERRERYEKEWEMDMSYHIPGVARFRVNVFRQRNAVGGVMRVIPARCKTIDELELPQILKHLAMLPRGLVLVTGPTGSGKSTTLAACIDHINRHRRCHVITIEDPIEFVHDDNLCAVEQRELGEDTHTFADALKHVMRQAPDVILVGEMRDLETISLAITAAETGHLVFATLHTTDAPQTIDRIIDVFSAEQQEQIRTQLAVTLQAVVSQTLLPLADRPGRVPAFEIMLATPAIRALIREAKTHQVYSMIETGADFGMISLDQYLLSLMQKGTVSLDHALSKSSNPEHLNQRWARMSAALAAQQNAPPTHGRGRHGHAPTIAPIPTHYDATQLGILTSTSHDAAAPPPGIEAESEAGTETHGPQTPNTHR